MLHQGFYLSEYPIGVLLKWIPYRGFYLIENSDESSKQMYSMAFCTRERLFIVNGCSSWTIVHRERLYTVYGRGPRLAGRVPAARLACRVLCPRINPFECPHQPIWKYWATHLKILGNPFEFPFEFPFDATSQTVFREACAKLWLN